MVFNYGGRRTRTLMTRAFKLAGFVTIGTDSRKPSYFYATDHEGGIERHYWYGSATNAEFDRATAAFYEMTKHDPALANTTEGCHD